jgi:hypothetical protein
MDVHCLRKLTLAAEPRNTAALAEAARVDAARRNRAGDAAIATRLREAGVTVEHRSGTELEQ